MTQEQLQEVLRLHKLWLDGKEGGLRANLRGVNLLGANLQGVNLRGVNLLGANLQGANLQGANLQGANLQGANLRYANLQGAYLQDANLQDAYLQDAYLQNIGAGNLRHIKTLQTEKYYIVYTAKYLRIGCKKYTFQEWEDFDDDTISKMDDGALEWWKKFKRPILDLCYLSPCEPTNE